MGLPLFHIERTVELSARADGGSTIRRTAVFDPADLLGLGYWYAIYLLHAAIFCGMLANIARRAGTSHQETH